MPRSEHSRRIVYMPLDEIDGAPVNPKGHDDDGIAASIEAFGVIEQMTLDERTQQLISGHGRRDNLRRLEADGKEPPEGIEVRRGKWYAPVVRGWASEDDEHRDAALVAVNRLVEKGGWVAEELGPMLDSLRQADPVLLELSGYDGTELDELLASLGIAPDPTPLPPSDPDELPEVPEPIAKLGDIWQLGEHRLVCGDATDPAVLEAALMGRRPGAIFADPPYGISLDTDYASWHTNEGGTYRPVIGDDEPFDPSPFFERFADVAEQFWWGADYYRQHLPPGGGWVVWDKRFNVETDDGEQSLDRVHGSTFELCWSRQAHRRLIARILWTGRLGLNTMNEDIRHRVHPTQKPLVLAQWFFERWVPAGGLVLDPYAGSGTTLIGCETTGRPCATVELDPGYVDVIVARWEKLTGQEAVRLEGA